MFKYTILLTLAVFVFVSCPGGGDDSKDSAKSPKANEAVSNAAGSSAASDGQATAESNQAANPLERGYEIFHTTAYSNTSLACANCHADSVETGERRIYIASSGHGSFSRGAWKITKQVQLDAGEGNAKTLIDAANFCVKAPYMNHGEQLIEGSDAEALLAYLESIATEDEPFIIARPKKMPVGGLLNDEDNGERIYAISCKNCHDSGLEEVPELSGSSDWINALQVMAKVRKIGDNYYNDWAEMDYASYGEGEEIPVPAQAANPCGDNPCGENPCGEGHEGHDHGDDQRMFGKDAMPFYSTDILNDQDLVDVAYYLAKVL